MTAPIQPAELRRLLDDAAGGTTTAVFDEVFRRAHRQRRAWRAGLVAATAAVVAIVVVVPTVLRASNAAPQQVISTPLPGPAPSLLLAHSNPLALVGRWHLIASGEKPGTSLILGDELSLFRPCGLLQGSWRADGSGLFVGDVTSGDGACFHTRKSFSAPWLTEAVGFRVEGQDRVLLSSLGQIVARLSPGAHPTTGPNDAPSYADAPKLTTALRATLAEPPPLPAGLRAASPTDVIGRWTAPDSGSHSPDAAYVAFNADGMWNGSDGCNGYGGRFAVGPAGELLTTSGGSTLVGCNNSTAPNWVVQARRVGDAGDQLVLLDAKGDVLGRLSRQPTGHIDGTFERVGGPAPGAAVPLSGDVAVHLNSAKGPLIAEGQATDGQFELDLPAGRYVFVGSSQQVNSGHGCPTDKPMSVAAGETVRVLVTCQIR